MKAKEINLKEIDIRAYQKILLLFFTVIFLQLFHQINPGKVYRKWVQIQKALFPHHHHQGTQFNASL